MDPLFDRALFESCLTTKHIGRRFVYRESIDTTMTLARSEAESGCPHGTLVLAEEQTAGRGRRGRSFHSPPGENIYATLVLRITAVEARRLTLAVPLAVAEACRASAGVAAMIKWPNDVWIGERKVCGILIDAFSDGDATVAMPGIGINVNGDPTTNPELAETATSLIRETGRRTERERLLAGLCNGLEAFIPVLEPDSLESLYRERSLVLGREVLIDGPAGQSRGIAESIGPSGALMLRCDNGELREFSAGDVSLRPAGKG